jgi:VWFA-related protein
MKKLLSLVVALGVTLPLAAQQPASQQPKYSERMEVNAVLVDATVTDRSGHQILGLDTDDFIVKEDGTPQQIDSVDYFTNRRLLSAQESQAPFKAERIRSDRYFVIFVDKPANSALMDELMAAKRSAILFVQGQLQPGDRVAVVGQDVRLKVFSDFTSDKAALAKALEDAVRFGRGVTKAPAGGGDDSILRHVDLDKMMIRSGTVYEAVQVLAEALRPIHARKELILLSPGILEQGQTIFAGMPSESRFYKPMIHALNAANVTVYPINLLRDASVVNPTIHTTLEQMAADTNGEYFRGVVNFDNPLKKIEQESSGYYLITYRSNKPRGTSGYQKIDVSLRNPEFRIRAREGYTFGDKS